MRGRQVRIGVASGVPRLDPCITCRWNCLARSSALGNDVLNVQEPLLTMNGFFTRRPNSGWESLQHLTIRQG